MIVIWRDSDELGSDEEIQNVANLCFIAQEDEINLEPSLEFTFNELQDAFYDLIKNFKKLA